MWVDAHIHLFDIHRPETQWPTPAHPDVLYRNSYPEDFSRISEGTGIEKAISVECVSGDKWEDKNNLWTFELIQNAPQIAAAIGSIPLDSENFGEIYARYLCCPKFRGIRIRPDISLDRLCKFEANLRHFVPEANVVEIVPAHFSNLYAVEPIIAQHPEISFVIDHFAWYTTDGNQPSALFNKTIKDIAAYPNVSIKLSGLLERAACRPCSTDSTYYHPMLTSVVETFGVERCMFGSDYPPCRMFGSYQDQVRFTVDFIRQYGEKAVELVMGENAARIYQFA